MAIVIVTDKAAVKRKLTVTDQDNGTVELEIQDEGAVTSLVIGPAERNALTAFLLRVED